jgi:hypothetical protein
MNSTSVTGPPVGISASCDTLCATSGASHGAARAVFSKARTAGNTVDGEENDGRRQRHHVVVERQRRRENGSEAKRRRFEGAALRQSQTGAAARPVEQGLERMGQRSLDGELSLAVRPALAWAGAPL